MRPRLRVPVTLRRLRTHAQVVSLAVIVVVSAATGAALAFWTSSGEFTAGASLTTLSAPTITSATPGVESVALSWSAVPPPGAGAVEYYVSRDGGPAGAGCPSRTAPSSVTSCTDTGVPPGNHTYTVTAIWRTWSATSSEKTVTVTSNTATHLVLEAASVTPTAGEADALTIVAKDATNNPVKGYAGPHALVFEGASAAPSGNEPTVADEAGTARKFAESTTIRFTEGKATVSGSANGLMRLYKAGEAHIKVREGSLNNGAGLAVTVKPSSAASFKLSAPNPAEPEAGQAFSVTLSAFDTYGNLATTYGGAGGETKTIAYSGPEASPSGKAPEYPTTATAVSFKEGVGTATAIKLYKAAAQTLTAKEGTREGSTAAFTVKPGAFKSFSLTPVPAEPEVGAAVEVKLTALDEWHNTITSYARTHKLQYEGAENAPNGKAPEYSTTTEPTFTAGVASIPGFHFYKAASTTLKVKEETSGHEGTGTFNVKAGTAASFKLSAPTPAEPEAGQALNVTITALDAGGNLATSYGGAAGEVKTIAYSGPGASPSGKAPEYPTTATSGHLQGRRRHRDRHQALQGRIPDTHREGRRARRD